MARHKSLPPGNGANAIPAPDPWTRLTWDQLTEWAGEAAVARGRDYRAIGRVQDLKRAEDGALLATVNGKHRYATAVRLDETGKSLDLDSECTCPVGFRCKHAVATVAEYLQAVAAERAVPLADPDDPRWARLEGVGDEFEADEDQDEREEDFRPPSTRQRRTKGWDAKVEGHIRDLSRSELADLAWKLIQRLPDAYQEIRDRITLTGGGVARLIAETRGEIAAVTAEPGWQRHWTNEGYTPDFPRIAVRFERLLELGQADAIVQLARGYIQQAQDILEQSDDEGDSIDAFGETMPVIFTAVAQSSLAARDKILFVIDAALADEYDTIGSASDVVLEACTDPAEWSAVVDILTQRLKPAVTRPQSETDFASGYRRERITDWTARALVEANRSADLEALYEAEAHATGSYRRLVHYLVEADRLDDAERWATEGIAASAATAPGEAEHLAASLATIARKREQWDLVAAHAARPFFERPTPANLDVLLSAARQAQVEPEVRAAALRFLETGAAPWRWLDPPPTPVQSKPSTAKRAGRGATTAVPEPAAARRLGVDPAWPLPMPAYFLHLMSRLGQGEPEVRPRFDVLLEMALLAGDADEVIRRFEQFCALPRRTGWYPQADSYGDRVAATVATRHPARALELYTGKLNVLLPRADPGAYASAVEYLKALRPLYTALDRAGEWDELVASIRLKYKNRPRFMELLVRLPGPSAPPSSKPPGQL